MSDWYPISSGRYEEAYEARDTDTGAVLRIYHTVVRVGVHGRAARDDWSWSVSFGDPSGKKPAQGGPVGSKAAAQQAALRAAGPLPEKAS